MVIPLPLRVVIYAATAVGMILTYRATGSALAAFVAALAVLFGGIEVALRGRALPTDSGDRAEGQERRWTWTRVAWLALLFGIFNLMPTFGWGATRILTALIVMLAFVELESILEAKSRER